MDILKEMPVDQWPTIQEKMKRFWPLNVGGYYALHSNIKYPGLREAFQFKVYCPYGDMENGFIATTVKNRQDYIIFAVTEDTSKLEEALMKTELIDWNKHIRIGLVSPVILRCLEKIKSLMGFKHYHIGSISMYYLDRTAKPFQNVRCPSETYIAPVKEDHIHHVNDVWPYKFLASNYYFSKLASNGLSYGLYSCGNDRLLAWLFLSEYNFLCHLFCEEEYRRKGYGEFVLKCAVNEQLSLGNDVYGFVAESKEIPTLLFLKLGFEVVHNDNASVFVQKI